MIISLEVHERTGGKYDAVTSDPQGGGVVEGGSLEDVVNLVSLSIYSNLYDWADLSMESARPNLDRDPNPAS